MHHDPVHELSAITATLPDDPVSSTSVNLWGELRVWPARGCAVIRARTVLGPFQCPQPCPARHCPCLSLLPAIQGDCCLDWQGIFKQIPSLPAFSLLIKSCGILTQVYAHWFCHVICRGLRHFISNSSTLSLCLSPSLTLGSDFNGVGYGAIYSWQIKGRKS